MQPVGGTPAALSWVAETVLGAFGAPAVEATALQLCGRGFLSLREVVAALDELEPVELDGRLPHERRGSCIRSP
jgi:hypothetical protein